MNTRVLLFFLVAYFGNISAQTDKPSPLELNNDPNLLNSMMDLLRTAKLEKYIVNDAEGRMKIDVRSLILDPNAFPVMVKFLRQHGYSNLEPPNSELNPSTDNNRLKRNLFNSIGDFFSNMFKSIVSTVQQNFMMGFQNLISSSIKQILVQIEQTLFLGTPINFNEIATQFIVDFKISLRNVIVSTVEVAFQEQALRLLDLQADQLNKILESLKNNQLSPIQFINSLQNVIGSINYSLKAFVPSISDVIGGQLNKLLLQLLNSLPPFVNNY